MATHRTSCWNWAQYTGIWLLSSLVCWFSLAGFLKSGGSLVSILSWNVFGLKELLGYYRGNDGGRALTSSSSIVSSALAALLFPAVAALTRSQKFKPLGFVLGVLLLLATVIWFPNPWENM